MAFSPLRTNDVTSVRLVQQAVPVRRPPRLQHLVVDLGPVDLHLVHTLRRRVQRRPPNRRVQHEGAAHQDRLRAAVRCVERHRACPPATLREEARPRRAGARSTPTGPRRARPPAPTPRRARPRRAGRTASRRARSRRCRARPTRRHRPRRSPAPRRGSAPSRSRASRRPRTGAVRAPPRCLGRWRARPSRGRPGWQRMRKARLLQGGVGGCEKGCGRGWFSP